MDHCVKIYISYSRDADKIMKDIQDSSHINGWTNQAAALRIARELFYDARPNAAKYVIMVTDGYPTVEIGAESIVAKQLRDIGVRMIMIGEITFQLSKYIWLYFECDGVNKPLP